VEQYYGTAFVFSRSEDRGSGESSIRESIPAFHYAQWKCNVDLELVSPETLLPATTVPVLLIHGRDDRNTEKTLITKARVVLDRSVA
jgi:pimeloyl-ACP methyl ester carboxylesterase